MVRGILHPIEERGRETDINNDMKIESELNACAVRRTYVAQLNGIFFQMCNF